MKKAFLVLLAILGVLVVAFYLGPRVEVDTTLNVPVLPQDLDIFLSGSEARFSDIIPGTEKTIVWADSTKEKTPLSIVYLHGFSATRQEVHPLADTLAARLHANLFYTRLTGHGRPGEAMSEATVNDWLNDGAEALAVGRRLGERVMLLSTSNGAALATWLAAQPEYDDLAALVLISPNFHPKDDDARFLLLPWGRYLARIIVGDYYEWEASNALHEQYWTTRYPSEALVTMMGLVDLVENTDLGEIETPTLVIYSPSDQVVNPEKIAARFPEFGATKKKLVVIEEAGDPSDHVLAGAILSPEETLPLADTIYTFIRPLVE